MEEHCAKQVHGSYYTSFSLEMVERGLLSDLSVSNNSGLQIVSCPLSP